MSDPQRLAERVVSGMLARDEFSRWLGLEAVEVAPGRSVCRMRVRDEMVNGLGVAHGAIVFALADSAFAFACNTGGRVTLSIENSIAYPAPVRVDDELTATAEAEAQGRRLGYYRVVVTNQEGSTVGLFRGAAYATERPHPWLA